MRLDAVLLFPRPKSTPKWKVWHAVRPDRDNVEKALLDAMTRAGWWRDDALICAGWLAKRYAQPGEEPGAIVDVAPLKEESCQPKNSPVG